MNWIQRFFFLRKRECCIRLSAHWVAGGRDIYMQFGTDGDVSAMAACMVRAMDEIEDFKEAVEIAAREYYDPERQKFT